MTSTGHKNTEILFTCSDENSDFASKILDYFKKEGWIFLSMRRSLSTVGLPFDYTRQAIQQCSTILAVFTDNFEENQLFLYEVALAAHLHKTILVIRNSNVTISDLFGDYECFSIDELDAASLSNLKSVASTLLTQQKPECQSCNIQRHQKIQSMIWSLEDSIYNTHQRSIDQKSLDQKKFEAKREREFQEQIVELRDKLGHSLRDSIHIKLSKESFGSVVSPTSQPTEAWNRQTFVKECCVSIQSVRESLSADFSNNGQVMKRLSSMPPEIKECGKKYENRIGRPFIRKLGRSLNLNDADISSVENYTQYGINEMYWQTIRLWISKEKSDRIEVCTLIDALKSCGLGLQGNAMVESDRRVLDTAIPYLLENLNIDVIIPHLIGAAVVCDVTKDYIMSGRTRNEKLLRLVDIMKTQEDALLKFQDAILISEQEFIARHLSDLHPESERLVSIRPLKLVQHARDRRKGWASPRCRLSGAAFQSLREVEDKEIPMIAVLPTPRSSTTVSDISAISYQLGTLHPSSGTISSSSVESERCQDFENSTLLENMNENHTLETQSNGNAATNSKNALMRHKTHDDIDCESKDFSYGLRKTGSSSVSERHEVKFVVDNSCHTRIAINDEVWV